jgi:hypothetical protein
LEEGEGELSLLLPYDEETIELDNIK